MHLRKHRAFTLLELLVVMSIIGIIAAIVVPASTSMMMSSRLTDASAQVVAQLTRARQIAIAHNRTVEVRFYQFGDGEIPGESAANPSTGKYRALQVFEYADSGSAIPSTKIERLPDGVIFDSGATLSTLFSPTQKKTFSSALDTAVSLPRGVGTNYTCSAFRISPSGSAKLSLANWFVTVHRASDGDALATPPHNYSTIQIDAASGAVKVYRP